MLYTTNDAGKPHKMRIFVMFGVAVVAFLDNVKVMGFSSTAAMTRSKFDTALGRDYDHCNY